MSFLRGVFRPAFSVDSITQSLLKPANLRVAATTRLHHTKRGLFPNGLEVVLPGEKPNSFYIDRKTGIPRSDKDAITKNVEDVASSLLKLMMKESAISSEWRHMDYKNTADALNKIYIEGQKKLQAEINDDIPPKIDAEYGPRYDKLQNAYRKALNGHKNSFDDFDMLAAPTKDDPSFPKYHDWIKYKTFRKEAIEKKYNQAWNKLRAEIDDKITQIIMAEYSPRYDKLKSEYNEGMDILNDEWCGGSQGCS